MERTYNIFEKMKDRSGCGVLRFPGHEAAIRKLQEMAQQSTNEFHLMHIATKTTIDRYD